MQEESEIKRLRTVLQEVAGAGKVARSHEDERGASAGPSPEATLAEEALRSPELHPEEEQVLEDWRSGSADARELMERLMAERIKKALGSLSPAGGSAPRTVPNVIVARGADEFAEEGDVTATVLVRSGLEEQPDEEGSPSRRTDTVVIAERPAYRELAESLPRREATVLCPANEPGSVAASGRAPLKVVEVESLGEVEATLRQALPEDVHPILENRERDLTGQVLSAKYKIVRKVGSGGFGTVYEAVDELLGARVAIKLLNPNAARSKDAFELFLEEAQLLTNLDHENVVRWITFDKTKGGLHYFVMEFLQGEELSAILEKEGRLSPKRTQAILLQVLAALRAAHSLSSGGSLLHLDLKPQNVFVLPESSPGSGERVKVFDFGIGQHVGAVVRRIEGSKLLEEEEIVADLEESIATRVTPEAISQAEAAGDVQRARGGTLLYSSPEQCAHLAGHRNIISLDGRSDLYSLGVMAFKMLTGEYPFPSCNTTGQAFRNHLEVPPRRVGSLGVRIPRKLAAFVDRCLRKDRDERWESTEEAYAQLDAIVHPPAWHLAAKIAAPLVALAVVLFLNKPDPGPTELDLYLAGNTGSPVLEGQSVFLGPERPTIEVELVNYDPGDEETRLRLLEDPATPDTEIEGWETTPLGGNRYELSRRLPDGEQSPSVQTVRLLQVYAQLLNLDERVLGQTKVFQIRYLGADAWGLVDVVVPGLEGRVLDPTNQRLEIRLQGDPAEFREISVALDGTTARAEPATTVSEKGLPAYEVAFGNFELSTGIKEFAVTVVDKAGRRVERSWRQAIDTRQLELQSIELLECPLSEGKYVVTSEEVELSIELNRRASIEIDILDSQGNPVQDVEFEAPSGEDDRFSIDLPLARDSGYNGSIRVTASDSLSVFHLDQQPRGHSEQRVDFQYSPDSVQVTVKLGEDALEQDRPRFVSTRDLNLEVVRTSVVPVVVKADWGLPDATRFENETRLLGDQFENVLPISLTEVGAYSLRVAAHRHLGSRTLEEPERVFSYQIVLDTSPPTVSLQGPEGLTITSDDDGESKVRLVIEDEAIDSEIATPVHLKSTISRKTVEAGADWSTVESAELEEPYTPSSNGSPFDLPTPWTRQSNSGSTDGLYRIELSGADAAGTPFETATFEWTVAREGPQIAPEWPKKDQDWEEVGEARFPARVRASDPNGVRNVFCSITEEGGSLEAIERPMQRSKADKKVWVCELPLNHNWSERTAVLTFRSTDLAGVTSKQDLSPIMLPRIERKAPDRIGFSPAVASGADHEVELTPMRFIRGNDDFFYAFQGRGDDAENDHFHELGLPPYSSKRLKRSENVTQDPGDIKNYYLDEHEVTVAQFLAFLRHASGYENGRNWAEGVDPAPGRRDELEQALQALPDKTAVTGIDWYEASAYSKWADKRLPTWLEWEYAVRGGTSYRPFSTATTSAVEASMGEPSSQDFNYGGLQGGGSIWPVWPVDKGQDVSAAGVWNLCSNVSEWSSTPAPRDGQYFAVGANYDSKRCDFSVVYPTAQGNGDRTIGFRCALAAGIALDKLGDTSSPIKIRSLD